MLDLTIQVSCFCVCLIVSVQEASTRKKGGQLMSESVGAQFKCVLNSDDEFVLFVETHCD